MKEKKALGIVILIMIGLGLVIAIRNSMKPKEPTVEKLTVVATFYPLAEFARQVGGDNIQLKTVIPNGVEPHDFEPTPQDIRTIQSADVIVYIGPTFESWFSKIESNETKSTQRIINISERLNEETKNDPHVWLSPVLAQQITSLIQLELSSLDPEHQSEYENNAKVFNEQLVSLDQQYKNQLSTCKKKKIVASHDAYGYLGSRYGFEIIAVTGLSPEEEPSPAKLAEIAKVMREQNLKFIMHESLISSKLSDTIAKEVGAESLVLNPLEGLTVDQIENGENYLSVQQSNIANLKRALECI